MHVAVKYRTNPPTGGLKTEVHDEFCRRLKAAVGDQFGRPMTFAMLFRLGTDGKVDASAGSGFTSIPGQASSRPAIAVLDYVTEAAKDLEFAPPGGPNELRVEIQMAFPPGL